MSLTNKQREAAGRGGKQIATSIRSLLAGLRSTRQVDEISHSLEQGQKAFDGLMNLQNSLDLAPAESAAVQLRSVRKQLQALRDSKRLEQLLDDCISVAELGERQIAVLMKAVEETDREMSAPVVSDDEHVPTYPADDPPTVTAPTGPAN